VNKFFNDKYVFINFARAFCVIGLENGPVIKL
jgi:hypothetical protein